MYFIFLKKKVGKGDLEFYRQNYKNDDFENIEKNDAKFEKIEIFENGEIHDSLKNFKNVHCVDFANKFIGGAAYSYGNVQEEILFNTNPELLISRLIMEEIDDTEAIIMKGAEKFSEYKGYSFTLQFAGDYIDSNFDNSQCLNVEIAIDALDFRGLDTLSQFSKSNIDREIKKCLSGFMNSNDYVSTGNWVF
jgi:poly(ADP-ribose) glycohydrolase